jgi:hypothetical protein
MRYMVSHGYGRLREEGCVTNRFVSIGLMVMLSVAILSGCSGAGAQSVQLETYVGQLCKAIGPFESDAQKFGRVLSKYTLRLKSRESERQVANVLTPVIADSRNVVTTMQAVGTPDIHNGSTLAAATLQVFNAIAKSDTAWRSELRAGVWIWPTASRTKRERVRTSLEALIQVGRQFEALPDGLETQNAMARSPVCRYVFGTVRMQQTKR